MIDRDKIIEKYAHKVIKSATADECIESRTQRNSFDEEKNGQEKQAVCDIMNISIKEADSAAEKHSLEAVTEKIKEKFKEIYNVRLDSVRIVTGRTEKNVNAFVLGDRLVIDTLTECMIHEMMTIIFVWSLYSEDKSKYGRFFNYLTSVLYAVSNYGLPVNIYSYAYIKQALAAKSNVFNTAALCEYFIYYFTIAHELAHKYLDIAHIAVKGKFQEEYMCDSIAYRIVLEMMGDENKCDVENRELMEYCFFAPMMLFDCMELLCKFNKAINRDFSVSDDIHPELKKRKENLFSIAYDEAYCFDRDAGADLYNCFLDVLDYYEEELMYRKQSGVLSDLLDYLEGRGK